jgi:hypothetical protein
MFCRISEDRMSPLPERLRALPAFAPPPGGWQDLSARLAARRRRVVIAGSGFALAASVLVAVGLVALRPVADAPQVRATVASSTGSQAIAQLISRSQALERELHSARPQVAMWSSGRDARAALIEQELRRVDAQINFADQKSAEPLWRRRVQLMNALVELHQTEAPALHYASYQY